MNLSNNSEEMTLNKTNDLYGTKSASLPPTPSKQMAGVKRQRKVDATKFNRSNRESKNCGTFYFKHSDTEPESGSIKHNDWSSQGATSEVCSEEEWEYSKGSDVNGNTSNGHEDNGDNEHLADSSIQINVNESVLFDTVDSPFANNHVGENDKLEQQIQSTPVSVASKSSVERKLYKEIAKVNMVSEIQIPLFS